MSRKLVLLCYVGSGGIVEHVGCSSPQLSTALMFRCAVTSAGTPLWLQSCQKVWEACQVSGSGLRGIRGACHDRLVGWGLWGLGFQSGSSPCSSLSKLPSCYKRASRLYANNNRTARNLWLHALASAKSRNELPSSHCLGVGFPAAWTRFFARVCGSLVR